MKEKNGTLSCDESTRGFASCDKHLKKPPQLEKRIWRTAKELVDPERIKNYGTELTMVQGKSL